MKLTRRGALGAAMGGAAIAGTATTARAFESDWKRGLDGQRKADLGNGTFLNPVMAGDHPDPSVLKDGDDYYMTFSSFDAYPGLVVWHSRDLVNWQPLQPTLFENVGSVWAPDLVKHNGRYYIYFPGHGRTATNNFVVHADDIRGPWSAPIDLKIPAHIDPGHIVGEDGARYLFLSGGDYVKLTDDGLATDGEIRHVYDGWKYPESWDMESFSPEGPKMRRHGDWFYMTLAEGGTAGPPTSHLVVSARSRSIHGPWENSPYNPIVRTKTRNEKWWSRGHATLVEAPDKSWWIMHHGYENGFWTLGRQTLLAPIRWTRDGWFTSTGGDLSRALPKPRGGSAVPHGLELSDDFSSGKLGLQWAFYAPADNEHDRVRFADRALILKGKGTAPADASPLTCVAGDQAYRFQVEIERDPGTCAGALLFYSHRLYAGLGFDDDGLVMHRYGTERRSHTKPGRRLFLRVTNDRHVVRIHTSGDGQNWTKYGVEMEVSGYHHNTAGDFLSLRPGFYAGGAGEVRFRDFRYEALA
ncbi:MAG: family 43 glycosylhydrolase [Alphaproteobacteria bacterium]|nr:family 43 glycosylhydrolase [Alphaproteobacteria bacterium]